MALIAAVQAEGGLALVWDNGIKGKLNLYLADVKKDVIFYCSPKPNKLCEDNTLTNKA